MCRRSCQLQRRKMASLHKKRSIQLQENKCVCVCMYILRCHVNKQQMTVLNNRKNMMYSISFVMRMSQIHLKNNLLTKCPHSMLSEADNNMQSLKLKKKKKTARIFNCTATSSPSCDDQDMDQIAKVIAICNSPGKLFLVA